MFRPGRIYDLVAFQFSSSEASKGGIAGIHYPSFSLLTAESFKALGVGEARAPVQASATQFQLSGTQRKGGGLPQLRGQHIFLSTFDGPSKSSFRTRMPTRAAGYFAEKVIPISGLQSARSLTKLYCRLDVERE